MLPSQVPETPSSRVGWRCFRALLPGFLLANLEGSLVNIVLPEIQRSLSLSLGATGWIPLACLIPTAAFCPFMGVLADHIGRRRIYLTGLLLIGLGSAVAGVATGLTLLLFGRVLQGLGCAALIANGLAIVAEQFEAAERGRALGLMLAMVGVGAIAAPPLGGAISEYTGWRGVFWISTCVAMLGVYGVVRRLPIDPPASRDWYAHMSWLRNTLLVVSVVTGVGAVWGGGRWGWHDGNTLAMLSVSLLSLSILIALARSSPERSSRSGHLTARTRWSLAVLVLGSLALSALGLVLPMYLSTRFGLEGLSLGLKVLPFPVGLVLGALLGGRIGDARGTLLPVMGGLVLFGVGVVGFSSLGASGLALAGLGIGAFSVGNNAELMHDRAHDVGSLTGLIGLLRLLGQALGVGLGGAAMQQLGAGADVAWIGWLVLPGMFLVPMAYRGASSRSPR